MGRKLQGAKLRAKKRSQEAAKEIVDSVAHEVETSKVTQKTDEELFVIDTTAALPSKKAVIKKEKKKVKHYSKSAKEQSQIDRMVAKHTHEQLEKLAKQSKATSRKAFNKGSVNPKFDLWRDGANSRSTGTKKDSSKVTASRTTGNNSSTVAVAGIKPSEHMKVTTSRALPPPTTKKQAAASDASSATTTEAIKVELAKSGQSYNPDKLLHKKSILEAIEIEKKRDLAEAAKKAPISTGMSEETRKFIVGDTDSEDESDADSDGNDDEHQSSKKNEDIVGKKKATEKLTRAQRNKQKRLRQEQREIQDRKRMKKFEGSIGEAKTISKQLRKQAIQVQERKKEIEQLRIESEQIKGKDVYEKLSETNPINAPTYPVALSSELDKGKKLGSSSNYSLRSMKPKGSLLTDRFHSILDRDMAPKKQLKQRRRVEGKRRKMKIKVKGKGHKESKEGLILG